MSRIENEAARLAWKREQQMIKHLKANSELALKNAETQHKVEKVVQQQESDRSAANTIRKSVMEQQVDAQSHLSNTLSSLQQTASA